MQPLLDRYLQARREAFLLESDLLREEDPDRLLDGLDALLAAARRAGPGRDEGFQLQAIADLLGKLHHPKVASLLLRLLDDPNAAVRRRAHDAILRWAHGRHPDLIRAMDAYIDQSAGPALEELPAIAVASADPDGPAPVGLLLRLLAHENPNVAAEAACALAEVDDPDVLGELLRYVSDGRRLDARTRGPHTLGELVEQLVLTARVLEDLVSTRPVGEA